MLNRLIWFSLHHRGLVLGAALTTLILGLWITSRMPVDVFPDLTAPTVTVITEGAGLAPEEIELLVTFPIESALNGAPGVRRIRSVSAAGISVIWAEFRWGEDVYRARQVVSERVQGVELPQNVDRPELGPVSSIMGEITFVALTARDSSVTAVELRRIAETVLRRSLLAVPGVALVAPIGGDVREMQVELDPAALAQHGVSLADVTSALESASASPAAGFHLAQGQEYLVRGLGRVRTLADLAATPIRVVNDVPITVGAVANVRDGVEPRRGTAAYRAQPAVILSVQKQPGANTLELTGQIDRVLEDVGQTLPRGVVIETENFRQADFIEVAIHNVSAALRDGAILVIIILFAFLGNLRATFITAIAIPLSLLAAIVAMSWFRIDINTMTLGGLTIAIGALVDDAIIGVENVFRRMREEHVRPPESRRAALEVMYEASSEVRKPILFATLIIVLVFVPLFLLPGMEGRLLRPLGFAYVVALAASLLVSLTVTPALCYYLLRNDRVLSGPESWLLRKIKGRYERTLDRVLSRPRPLYALIVLLFVGAAAVVPFLGRSFLPPFNEGSLTVSVVSVPGITLDESDALGRQVELALLSFPEVVSTSRRTGRAEKDEHVQGVNASEMEVVLKPGRPKEELLEEMRRSVATIPGVQVSFGQPISHRIDHMISGSKSSLAVKIFGSDLSALRGLAARAEDLMAGVPGIVDLGSQEQAVVPQMLVEFDRSAMARRDVTASDLSRTVEALFQGTEVGEIVDNGLPVRIVARFPEGLRAEGRDLASLPVTTPSGIVRLGDVARVRFDLGPSMVRRENVQRVAVLTANVAGSDLVGTVERVRATLGAQLALPPGYRIEYGGQFEEGAKSVRNLVVISVVILFVMYGLLFLAFRSHRHTWIILVNLPLALIGGVFMVALGSGVLSVATLVGFICLFGIATRNGVLLVAHYQHLMTVEGASLSEAVRRGSRERLAPVLMTALTAGLALIPLVLGGGKPGNEIQSPMGQVILGGLLTSTFLNMVLVPVLFERWGGSRESVTQSVSQTSP